MAGQGGQRPPSERRDRVRADAAVAPVLPPLVAPQLPETHEVERRSKENTRHRLVAASVQVFVEKGLAGATVDDLTRAAGFTRGAFYSNFSSREQVFEAAFAHATDLVIEAIRVQTEATMVPMPGQGHQVRESGSDDGAAEDSQVCVQDQRAQLWTILEALRPVGLTWYVLQNEAVVQALRAPEFRTAVNAQRSRIRAVVVGLFEEIMLANPRLSIDTGILADTLLGVFMNLMVAEQLDQPDTSYGVAIIDTVLNAFLL